MPYRVAVFPQRRHQFRKQPEGVVIGLEIGDLAADMHVDADDLDAGQFGRPLVDGAGALPGNAELVFLLAGRDLGVGARIDVRIDAEGDGRAPAGGDGAPAQQFQFRFRFDVEAVDAGGKRRIHFLRRLADAGEHDLFGAGCRRRARGAIRLRRRRPRRRRAGPASSGRPGWNSPSSRSRRARRCRKRRPQRPGSGASAWRWNSNRRGCRRPLRSRGSPRLRRGGRRRDSRNGSRAFYWISGSRMKWRSLTGGCFVVCTGLPLCVVHAGHVVRALAAAAAEHNDTGDRNDQQCKNSSGSHAGRLRCLVRLPGPRRRAQS